MAAAIAHIKSLIKECIPMTPSEMIPLRAENEKKLKEMAEECGAPLVNLFNRCIRIDSTEEDKVAAAKEALLKHKENWAKESFHVRFAKK
jgi:hypothetical protein